MGEINTKELVQLFCCKVGSQKAFMQQTGMNKCMFPPPFLQKGVGNGRVPPMQTLKRACKRTQTRERNRPLASFTDCFSDCSLEQTPIRLAPLYPFTVLAAAANQPL